LPKKEDVRLLFSASIAIVLFTEQPSAGKTSVFFFTIDQKEDIHLFLSTAFAYYTGMN
jgi:hypothetical protein